MKTVPRKHSTTSEGVYNPTVHKPQTAQRDTRWIYQLHYIQQLYIQVLLQNKLVIVVTMYYGISHMRMIQSSRTKFVSSIRTLFRYYAIIISHYTNIYIYIYIVHHTFGSLLNFLITKETFFKCYKIYLYIYIYIL